MILIPLSIEKCIFTCWFGAYPAHLTTKSNLYFDFSFATVMSEPALYRLLAFNIPNLLSILPSFGHLSQIPARVKGPLWHFITSIFFWDEELLAPRPTSK
jgi:hypothetical protein